MPSLNPEVYWHLTNPGSILLHNVRLSKGWLPSVSLIAKGDLKNAVTPYAMVNANSEKERLWEEVRKKQFTDRPSRIKAFFAFVSKEDAERAMPEWFPGENKVPVECSVVEGSSVHVADARYLDHDEPHWRDAATRYWQGDRTEDPRLEAVIDGLVYFPKWEQEPFGLMTG